MKSRRDSKTYTRTGRAKWLITGACEFSYRAANALNVLYAFSMRPERGCNTSSKFPWEYPASRFAKVSLLLYNLTRHDRSIHFEASLFFFFIRESHASNWWTGLCGPRLEPLRSREGERRTSWTPFNHLRTRCDRRRQAYLFFVEGQMHKSVGRPDPKLHSGC